MYLIIKVKLYGTYIYMFVYTFFKNLIVDTINTFENLLLWFRCNMKPAK